MKRLQRSAITVLILLGLGACRNPDATPVPQLPTSPLASGALASPLSSPLEVPSARVTLAPLTPQAGFGAAQGIIGSHPSSWTNSELWVYFAPFTPDEESGGGFYILEPSIHPRARAALESGFQHDSIPPGDYVVLVGPTPDEAIVIREGDRPRIVEFLAGQVVDLGEVDLK